jgi:hypothetical protein
MCESDIPETLATAKNDGELMRINFDATEKMGDFEICQQYG